MEDGDEQCFFAWKFDCRGKKEALTTSGAERIRTIIQCSRTYSDGRDTELQESLNQNSDLTIKCHRSCVSTYTSKKSISRHKRKNDSADLRSIPSKVTRRSSVNNSGETFDFRLHCLYCGMKCDLVKDPRHPDRWKEAYQFRELESKDSILKICDKRNDEAAACVRRRIEAILSDLHAEDARYHVDCRKRFGSCRSVGGLGLECSQAFDDDPSFQSLVSILTKDKSRIWNSVELLDMYVECGGELINCRKGLIKKLQDVLGDDMLVLSSPGLANLVAFRSHASKTLRLVTDNDEDDLDFIAKKASKQIICEVKDIQIEKDRYDINMNKDLVKESISDFLLQLLANLSPKLDNTLPALLIGSVVTSILKNQATSLQVGLGVKLGESKQLVNDMYKYGVSCSYTELRRFKKSAAKAAVTDIKLSGMSDTDEGLVQVIVDNFDAEIASQNGKLSTHSLAVIVTQAPVVKNVTDPNDQIRRVKKEEMSDDIPHDVEIHRYQGQKNPEMPQKAAMKSVLSLKALAHQALVKKRAIETDFAFIQDVITNEKCPEFNGYNTRLSRDQGHKEELKSKLSYQPLIDMKPSDPDTMITAMVRAQELTLETGQQFTVLTCDQQLYRVAVQVLWAHPEKFHHLFLRLGGMHALMSFVGAVGTLMAESGLSDILSAVFGGVTKMLSGKKFPQNIRALRMLAEEVLRQIFEGTNFGSTDNLMNELEQRARQSKTVKLWLDVLIKPVFIMMSFIRAEREGDWLLHLSSFRQMLPYYFAAGHINYARYGLYYLRTMEKLPQNVLEHFMKGEHVTRHIQGIWNGIWTDQFIETTFMRYGHSSGGIIGITLKPKALKVWALSRHLCCSILSSMNEMEDDEDAGQHKLAHKEESPARIESDGRDRVAIHQKLEDCIDPLDPTLHPDGIVNIATGEISSSNVNVHDAVNIGETLLADFERSWPDGFYGTIPKKVTTMAANAKTNPNSGNDKEGYDLNAIYSRVIGLLSSSQEIDIQDVFAHELAPVPASMFSEKGMRIAKNKSALKNKLQVEVSGRNRGNVDVIIIDGAALLWAVHWPEQGIVSDFVDNVKKRIRKYLETSDVYLIFDRYQDFSIKSVARGGRETGVCRIHHLNPKTKLPSQKVILTVVENKKQLMRIICEALLHDRLFHAHMNGHRLVVTGEDECPTEISNGGENIETRFDLKTAHEEADTIIVQQLLKSAQYARSITVICDDTDVFVLLLYHYQQAKLSISVYMESPSVGRTVIDIKLTVKKHSKIIADLLPAHALSGCDTVACCYGIGKGTVVKVLKAGHDLSAIGNIDSNLSDILKQSSSFISNCYGTKSSESMSQTRLHVWGAKNGKGHFSSPKLCSLPPTTAAFNENVKRAHFQAALWRNVDDTPTLNAEEYGWKKDMKNKTLIPVTTPEDVKCAPDYILNLIRCGCKSDNPCSSKRCSCRPHGTPCTIFCACYGIGCARLQ